MNPVQTAPDSREEILREAWKAEHIFREVGHEYKFSVSSASHLPLLTRAPLHIPADRDFVCLFGLPLEKDLSRVKIMFTHLEKRALNLKPNPVSSEQFNQYECLCIETMAHLFRHQAVLDDRPDVRRYLFDKAFNLYRSVLYACSHSSLTEVVCDIKAMSKKITLVSAVPDILEFSTEGRRRIAHCLAGMALCALMGTGNPVLFFGLSSAAFGWEQERPLELVNFLRIHLLLVGKFYLGLTSLSLPSEKAGESWEFVANSMATVDALLGMDGSSLVDVPTVYGAMTKKLVLPAVLKYGTATMLEQERGLIRPEEWEQVIICIVRLLFFISHLQPQCHSFAISVNQRMDDRTTGKIPTPTKLTRIHVVDCQFAERRCCCCGIWQTSTENKLNRCSRCRLVYYCSKECQREDWMAHKPNCKKML